jgi:diaminopimelate epimerase
MRVDFFKMHGTGNDFIVVDNFENRYNSWEAETVRTICRRRTGIGADGFLVLERSERADFRMRYYNSDGYESEMCVNGSRCISYFAYKKDYIKEVFTFEAGDGIHHGEIKSSAAVIVEVKVNKSKDELKTFPVDFELPEGIYFRNFINTGVPHLVLECIGINKIPVSEIGSQLRFHEYYQPEGTNVNFAELKESESGQMLSMRTFERGVDAETLSCGSGATAAALSFTGDPGFADKINGQIRIQMPGGELLLHLENHGKKIFIEGPVVIVYQGIYTREDYS